VHRSAASRNLRAECLIHDSFRLARRSKSISYQQGRVVARIVRLAGSIVSCDIAFIRDPLPRSLLGTSKAWFRPKAYESARDQCIFSDTTVKDIGTVLHEV
jgi:hypothetical protein